MNKLYSAVGGRLFFCLVIAWGIVLGKELPLAPLEGEQTQGEDQYNFKRKLQFSLIYPLATNGISTQYANYFSLNTLAGASGGLKGIELGGLLNFNRHTAEGLQFSELFNVTLANILIVKRVRLA